MLTDVDFTEEKLRLWRAARRAGVDAAFAETTPGARFRGALGAFLNSPFYRMDGNHVETRALFLTGYAYYLEIRDVAVITDDAGIVVEGGEGQ